MEKKEYRKAKMVNWFEPKMLFQTAIKSVISGLFGNYADRREMEAALATNKNNDNTDEPLYKQDNDIWIDFISDTGDGFNSTYSVALTAARPSLTVTVNGIEKELPRGKILLLGGDQIYPTPTSEIYDSKFRVPFKAAFPESKEVARTHMYAIPGNHDWYDGLGNFMKVFCQQRWIGNYETHQQRSYFAISLPHNYWIWATDIQLNEDIDQPQLNYFLDIARNKMAAGDKVILCTAEPAWVYKQLYKEDKSYEKLRFFIETYITEDRINCVGKVFELATVLTGDLHHYSHYCAANEKGNSNHYFGAGGGGAFLHLTHFLPEKLDKLKEADLKLQQTFPDKDQSRGLLMGNLIFPLKNYYFASLLGGIYILFFWLMQNYSLSMNDISYLESISDKSFPDFLSVTLGLFLSTPFLTVLSLLIIVGFVKFTDTKTGLKTAGLIGFIHGAIQFLLIFFMMWRIAVIHPGHVKVEMDYWYWEIIFAAELFLLGAIAGGFLMGFYLYFTNRLAGIHIDESSSSLACEDYKNFIRMHVSAEGLTIYPIGITKVTKNWEQHINGDDISFTGDAPAFHLIEDPIIIKNK
ncbi:MAG: metallophosphoesterase [Ferruginibacter sp.]